ncbi:MAG: alanine--tRNA ligase [Desulfitobacteriia bacterium]|jgi:alanyl-tRNA synthetase
MYTGNQLREMFLQFFEQKGHTILPSASLIPENDPTLLLTVAGMVPFKPYLMSQVEPPYSRVSTSQKCVRTPDLESVGKTARHHTFFEMLGNFSFGDYFKKEAIVWAWEFLTEVLKLPVEKLWVTVYPDDREAKDLWVKEAGVNPERVFEDSSNFWSAGPIGPCGPCSEIYIDLGEQRGCGKNDCAMGCDCDRFLEIWNLVFMQFNRDEQGNLTPLPKKNIDTGMGLERIASVLQGVESNFDTDLFRPLIDKIATIAGRSYKKDPETDLALKIVADHSRAVAFMLADGIRPSNEGRGYVLRRILRRAIRYARLLDIEKPFLEEIFRLIQDRYAHQYPELKANETFILNNLRLEEKNFQTTLDQGTLILKEKVRDLKKQGLKELSGEDAFHLYETYGFPVELTEEMLSDEGITVDRDSFQAAAEQHRQLAKEQSRQMRPASENKELIEKAKAIGPTEFCGYETTSAESTIQALFIEGKEVTAAGPGEKVVSILNRTPFYVESGGQVSDTGIIKTSEAWAEVMELKKLPNGTITHQLLIKEGTFKTGDRVQAQVDPVSRQATAINHSATHLLHSALLKVLGEHVQQAGSYVSKERLRFDFSHFSPLTKEEILAVEDLINNWVLANLEVKVQEMSLIKARARGAISLFGEKYGSTVRVVDIGDCSMELCGGTHVKRTGEIGLVKIISESGIGSGLRRIEALAGKGTLNYLRNLDEQMEELNALLKAQPQETVKRVVSLLAEVKDQEKEIRRLSGIIAKQESESLVDKVQEVQGLKVLAAQIRAQDMEELRQTADLLKDKIQEGVIVLGTVAAGKANFVTVISPPGLRNLHAGKIIKEVAAIAGGGGGGRPDMAQAGGKDPSKIGEALDKVVPIIKKFLE